MYGHDPLLVTLLLVLAGLGIGCVQHRWPAIGEAIDVATKVLITLIGLLIFASSGTTEQSAPTNPAPAPSMSATPSPAGQDHNDADDQDVPAAPARITPHS
ncbi:hypothetical protein [Streptomyces sp. NBC_00439]|uniref:hypothetical protein n=1 Tax=unclassified Streptomyces TaxID=2593676 RepID=UPI002255534F|nr:hypothetical protein [Streptomyces sp. NBC_00439]MCX5106999.1 hypothetical protein [Streptomyces sp. NBC_00439]